MAALARELQVRRKWLYAWRIKLDAEWADRGLEIGEPRPTEAAAEQRKQIAALQNQVKQLERLTAQQALDLSFFKAASQELEKLRRANKKAAAAPSTPQSKR